MPIPRRSISCELPSGRFSVGVVAAALPLDDGAGLFGINFAAAACFARSSSSWRSFSLSYPSWRIRSASSAAFLSASAKSMGAAAFFAPRPPSFDLRGTEAEVGVVRVVAAGDEFRREAPSLEAGRDGLDVDERSEEELMVRGAAATVAARPMTGGVAGVRGAELVDFAAGLSQEEKKSSSAPSLAADAGVAAPVSTPSTTTPLGNLQ